METEIRYDSEDVQTCPFPAYRAMRETGPVYRLPGSEVYLITRYEDVLEAFKRPDLFSSHRPSLASDPEISAVLAKGYPTEPTLTTQDPPKHTAYRKLIKGWFTASAIAEREPVLRSTVDDIIDEFAGDGRVEFVSQFAEALPMRIVGDFLGQPRSMAPQLKRWAQAIVAAVNPTLPREQAIHYAGVTVEFQQYFVDDIAAKRREPGEDFLSFLVNAELNGAQLSLAELLDYVRVFVTGGNDTVTALLSNTMYQLLAHPDQLQEVIDDRSLIPNALEEGIRYDSPGHFFTRTTENGDVTLGDVTIPQGARVMLVAGSGNRDPEAFPDADRFDIHRNAGGHLAYGHGIHFCLGAPVARLESRIAFERLFERLPNLRLGIPIEDVPIAPQTIIRRVERLPLLFDPHPEEQAASRHGRAD
jgi:cytochrome P450